MPWSEALTVLGLSPTCDEAAVRRAYRGRLLDTHPDLSDAHDATERTVRLTTAYRTVLAQLQDPGPPPDTSPTPASTADAGPAAGAGAGPVSSPGQSSHPGAAELEFDLVDADTISVTAPAGETLALLIDAAHRLGDIAYLDRGAGLLEIIVEFVGEPTSSVVLSLQGRATGVTEVFCTVEPLSGGDAPPSDAVTRLVLRTLRGDDPSS